MNESQLFQLTELKKLSVDFYKQLAYGKEPLTYTYSESHEGKEIQVEINSRINEKLKGVLVDVDFDTDWRGRWVKTTSFKTFYLDTTNRWLDSSFDGSEFIV